ncbi:MAG: hypothetical protein PF545_07605, partial [Elusimicrobia bacterium]|nr:hypothetical protein [Elusimicrobiota bacterium]
QDSYNIVMATSSDFAGVHNQEKVGLTTVKSALLNIWANTYNFVLQSGEAYYIGIRVKDDAEHYTLSDSLASNNIKINYDQQAPNVNWDTFSVATATNTGTPSVVAYLGDYGLSGIDTSSIVMKLKDNAGVKRTIPSTSYTTTLVGSSYTVTYTPPAALKDGAYQLSINVADDVLNYSGTTSGGWFKIDTTGPTLVDSDNDGTTDLKEKVDRDDPLDATDGVSTDNWPTNGEKVNYSEFVSGNSSKINIWIDDINDNSGSSGIDLNASTVTVTLPDSTVYTYGVNDLTYPKQILGSPAASGNGYAYNSTSFKVQLPVALKKDGSDDGTITVNIHAEDEVGNKSTTITRTFIYDNTVPAITTVSAPTTATTAQDISFSVNTTDTNGISDDSDAVKLYIGGGSMSLTKSTSTSGRYYYTGASSEQRSVKYYFTAKDYAGNISTYPAGADASSDQALTLTITDGSGPWAVIGNDIGGAGDSQTGEPDSYIKTLVGVNTFRITTDYNYASATKVDEIPNVYSASNNVLQATLEDDAETAIFQYKLSTTTSWTPLATSETALSQVWQAAWDTTGRTSGNTYDIRIKSTDTAGNFSEPSSVNSPGWVKVMLKPALGPDAKIDTANNDVIVGDGQSVRKYALLTASAPATTGNIDVATVTFQYRPSSGGSWTDIASPDNDPSSSDKTNMTFRFDLSDLPAYTQDNTLTMDTTTIETVEFNCTTDSYDRTMTKSGDGWEVTQSFPPGTYDYQFKVSYKYGSAADSFRDADEQYNGGANSSIIVTEYTALWDVSGLPDGSYHVRALANDSRGVADNSPEYITMKVDKTAPSEIKITQPTTTENRLKAGAATDLTAEVDDTDIERVIFLFSKNNGKIWESIDEVTDGSDGWIVKNWIPGGSLENDATCIIKAVAEDEAGNITESEIINVVIDATDPEINLFSINGDEDTEMDLVYGNSYSWTVTTTESYIERLELSDSGGVVTYSWSPGDNLTSYETDSGTHTFSGTVYIQIDTTQDNQADILIATLYDKAGQTDAKNITVNLKDVTPSEATIKRIDGFDVRNDEVLEVSNRYIEVVAELTEPDGGILKFQYKPTTSDTWTTYDTASPSADIGVIPGAETKTVIFPPDSITLEDGNYNLRALCIDDDNNTADTDKNGFTITVDSSIPAIKPASIISANYSGAVGWIGAVEYDEMTSAVKFEYKKSGETNWNFLDTDGGGAGTTYGGAGEEWTADASNLSVGTYNIRAISQYAGGPAEADTSETPISTLVIKRDAAGNTTFHLDPVTAISASLENVSFDSTYAGSEQTFTGKVAITGKTLTNVSARLLLASGIDRY